ncbi:WecB/TagA/CpsF family glycosyltransferase [Marinobacter sp.]|uniref:WecB/TagA/CpsF family glycosyltransferase n=1 Tax=Marinobacter sp. TaxID=50741 RepID=UPI001B598B8E|nr:WecB/TagA/CpsF family glycosyltransferase [Marinobacter sp.]MBQ0831294.1 WecB/TagA/CpsF family glycosyltransferase [Marinobacter sp.]
MKCLSNTVKIFGVEVSRCNLSQTSNIIFNHLESGNGPYLREDLNAHKVNLMEDDPKIYEIIRSSDMINADGASLIFAALALKRVVLPRVTGCDLFSHLLRHSSSKKRRAYFIGATDFVLSELLAYISSEFGSEVVAGAHNGYFDECEEKNIFRDISRVKPDFIFIGMPSPQKEFIAQRLRESIHDTVVIMGVGGSFDVLSGHVKRAPIFVQKVGMEWLYRIYQEPKRLWKRYFFGNLTFVKRVLSDLVGRTR